MLTDGEVANEEEIVSCARDAGCPVHVVGGAIAPNDAMRAVAEETGGRAVFLSPGDDIAAAVERFSIILKTPAVIDLSMPEGWETADGHQIRDLADGDDLVIPVSASPGAPELSLAGASCDGASWVVNPVEEPCNPAGLIWARARIRHLERRNDPATLALAKKFNLLCKSAAFVAWDEAEKVVIAKKEILQPSVRVALRCPSLIGAVSGPSCFGGSAVLESPESVPMPKRGGTRPRKRPHAIARDRIAEPILKVVKALNKLIQKKVIVPSAKLSEILLHLEELAAQSPAAFSTGAADLLSSLIDQLEALAKLSPQLANKTQPLIATIRTCRDSIAPVKA
jgi:hypothetical protein